MPTLASDLCGECHHTVDLHELTDFSLGKSRSLRDRVAARWKWRCHGGKEPAGLGNECTCRNFKLDER